MGLPEEEITRMTDYFDTETIQTRWCRECGYYHYPPLHYPKLNVDLLDKTMATIDTIKAFEKAALEIQDSFDMNVWCAEKIGDICGTTKCFAGWAIELSDLDTEWVNEGDDYNLTLFVNGRESDPEVIGAEVLGISRDEGNALFFAGDADECRVIVENIKDGDYRRK